MMSSEDENFDAKLKVVQEQVEHHVEEEEGKLFKQVKKQIDKRTSSSASEPRWRRCSMS